MCLPRTNQCDLKKNNTPDTSVARSPATDSEGTISRGNNPLTTPPSLFCVSQSPQPSAQNAVSEHKKPSSLFVHHLLEGLLARATSPKRRPSDVCQVLPGNVDELRPSGIEEPNQTPTGACPGSSADTASSASSSDDDTKALPAVSEEPDPDHLKDDPIRTTHEKDENKIHISRPEFVATAQHTLVKVGTISGILDNAVIVTTFNLADAHPRLLSADITTATALDTGSLLCFPDGNLLGAVFETFGPVASPLYVVRFNTSDEIPSATHVGQEIMYVEQEMSVVRARDVCRKGYDASGKDDEEVDAEEFSDDEKERRAKKLKRSGNTDRTAGPLKRKRGPRETQRQRWPERPPLRASAEFHGSAPFHANENERRWAGRNPYGSDQNGLRRYEAEEHISLQAHRGIQTSAQASHPSFIAGNAASVHPHYPAGVPMHVPSNASPSGTRGSSFNSHVTNTGYPVSFQPAPFSAPIAPFSGQMMPAPHQPISYPQFWAMHANYDHHGPNRHPNSTQQPYHGNGQPTPSYVAGPSHPYYNHEHRPYGAMNGDSMRELHHRGAAPNPNNDGEDWQRAPRQYHHM